MTAGAVVTATGAELSFALIFTSAFEPLQAENKNAEENKKENINAIL